MAKKLLNETLNLDSKKSFTVFMVFSFVLIPFTTAGIFLLAFLVLVAIFAVLGRSINPTKIERG